MVFLLPFLFGVMLGAAVMYALCDLRWAGEQWAAEQEQQPFNRRAGWL